MTEAELRKEWAGKTVRKVYLFYGNEQYSLRKTLDRMANAVAASDDLFNRSDFDGAVPPQEVYDAACSLPFMAERRVVVWRDAPIVRAKEEDYSAMVSLIADLPETTVLFLWFETLELDGKKLPGKLGDLIKKVQTAGGVAVEFSARSNAEINKLLCDGASRRGCRLNPSVATYIVDTCGDDLSLLINELDKLCSYAHGTTITKEAVDAVCTKNIDVSIYDLSKRLFALDMKAVYRILDDLFFMKISATYILSMLSGAFIDVVRARALQKSGEKSADHAADLGYGGKLAFRLDVAAKNGAKLTDEALKHCFAALLNCDKQLKSSRVNEKIILETLMTELAVILQKCR